MLWRRELLTMLGAGALGAQQTAPPDSAKPEAGKPPVDFICPMDRDVKQRGPGKCPRCGMRLTANLPEYVEYGFDIATTPRVVRGGAEAAFEFRVLDPKTKKPVREFEVMHEKLFHLFLVSSDLNYFAHEHPVLQPDGRLLFRTTLPRPGVYRVVGDCFPKGGAPQFLTRTLVTADAPDSAFAERAELTPSPLKQKAENLEVELTMQPAEPVAGLETLLFFTLRPKEGLEQYLGAWGHMLVGSDDLLDLIHDHPLYSYPDEPVRPQVQFNVIFPRARAYRIWVQFQRQGVVNTVAFNVPVKELA